ncbi:MAG: TonB family protein [Bryobacteraceae bacterium]|nr:TonB family protein [Bryobacteraceae bacterium]
MLRFGPYEVHEELGRGGMGVVYRGFDPLIQRDVALKTIKLYDISDEMERRQMQDRLAREAQSAGRLSHPNIVTIYQVGYAEMRPNELVAYIAMEYVPGRTLASVIEKTRATNHALVLKLLRQAADGLDYAHSQGVIHRDVKPANLLITADGRLKITDFGVAKLVSHTMTMTGTVLGSPFYMSPEQIRADRVDGRADQYALAVVAYEVFGGRKPFQADTLSALVYKIAHEAPPQLKLDSPALAGRLNPVLQRAMAKDSGERFPTCVAFVEALEKSCAEPAPVRLAETQPVQAPPAASAAAVTPKAPAAPVAARLAPVGRKVPWLGLAAALAVVAVMAGGVHFLRSGPAAPPEVYTPAGKEDEPVPAPEPARVTSRKLAASKAALPAAPAASLEPRVEKVSTAAPAKPKPEPLVLTKTPEGAKVADRPEDLFLQPTAPAGKTGTPPEPPAPAVTKAAAPEPPPAPREPVRTQPKLLQRAPAAYTNEARAAGIEGSVQLSVDIDERGIPVRARVLRSLDAGLDRNAIQSLGGWRFQPATEDGRPAPSTVNIEVQFSLVGAPSKQAPSLRKLKP